MKIFLILFCLFVSVDAFAERKVDAGTVELKHQAAPANPAAGYKRFYCKSDDECYFLNSAGTEQEILSGLVSLSSEVTGVLGISNGGTNSSTALNNNRIMQSSGGAIVEATAITANRALISDSNGIPTHSSVTNTELGYVSGVTSGIQGQLDQPNIPQTSDSSTGNIDALSTATFNSIRLTGAAPVLRGIANGSDGKIITVTNASGVSVTVSNENANPSAANRIITGTAADLTLADSASIWLQYDSTSSRWRVIGGSGGGSGVTDAVTKSIAQTGHGFAVGDVIRHNGTNYVDAQADSDSNAEVIGVVSAVADANNFTVTTSGFVSGLSGLTAGETYFLSPTTPGAITVTEPTGYGQVSKPVFLAVSTTSGYFIQSRGYVVGGNSGFMQPRSMVWVHTGNGYGSTNTKIKRFSTVRTSTGTAITYADSATLGGSFTINEAGVYAISFSDEASSPTISGISLNSTQLTTDIQSISASDRLAIQANSSDIRANMSVTVILAQGDVVRAHTRGVADGGSPSNSMFVITKVSN